MKKEERIPKPKKDEKNAIKLMLNYFFFKFVTISLILSSNSQSMLWNLILILILKSV
jgi:hypothetical protein